MKQVIFLFILICCINEINAQEPLIKFYLQDGSEKVYKLEDIDELSFIKDEISSFLTIFRNKDSLNAIYDTKYIEKIHFSSDKSKLNVFFDGNQFNYDLSNIDSIVVRQKEQRFVNIQINPDLPCLKELAVSSFADYNKSFNDKGTSSLIITDNGLPQLIMVSDKENNLIGMGLAKSTDSLVYINGISTAAAIVFQNVYMMGVPLDTLTDDVVDYILELGEVIYVGSQIEDSIKLCNIFYLNLNDEQEAILRDTYAKVYEKFTNKIYGIIGIVSDDKLIKIDRLQNQVLEVNPNSSSEIYVTAESISDKVNVRILNKGKRHIVVREYDNPTSEKQIGPGEPLFGSLFSKIWDMFMNSNEYNFQMHNPDLPIQSIGYSANKSLKAWPTDDFMNSYRLKGISSSLSSLWLHTIQSYLEAVFPLPILEEAEWFDDIGKILKIIDGINSSDNMIRSLDNGEYEEFIREIIEYMVTEKEYWENIIAGIAIKAGHSLSKEAIESAALVIASSIKVAFAVYDMVTFAMTTNQYQEYDVFYINNNTSKDLNPPEIEILAPISRDVASNSIVDIKVKLTDNENVKKSKLFLDYKEVFGSEKIWYDTKKEREFVFNWNTGNLLGLHYLTIYTEDEAGNKSSKLLALNISPNPNDKTKPNIEILNPTGDKITSGTSIPLTVKATDDNTVMQINVYINEIEVGKVSFSDITKQREHTFYLKTSNFPIGADIDIKVIASDANYNWGKVFKKLNVEGGEPGDFETVTIGTQVWMVKNLDVNTYRNGDPIPQVTDTNEWASLTTGAWCYYNNDPANGAIYGKLYNWYAVNDSRGLSPEGWHIPSEDEWTILETYLGGSEVAGGKMKETGTSHWNEPNEGATNSSGFSALPGGWRQGYNSEFGGKSNFGTWWSSSEYYIKTAWGMQLAYIFTRLGRGMYGKACGFSVRCVKD